MYDHVEQATMLRQEQVLKARGIQSASVDGGARYVEHCCISFAYCSDITFSCQILLQFFLRVPIFACRGHAIRKLTLA